ncbi:MAG: glycoside hydrolase family 2 TIM barrel-domain containing protein [Bacteroidota bacterium]
MLINKPRLWWPNNYGRANLYRIRLQYVGAGGAVADDTTFVFGIRTVSSKAVETNRALRRDFYVNGKRVNLVGGAWVPDMMVNRDSARYDYELHLCRNANVNLVRIWGGGVTPPDAFFNAADRYGLMVWSDFWITGDTQGEFKGSADWPLEGSVFAKNVISTIYRIRNHPSLLVWTGGNEGHARKELYEVMRNSIIQLDGTRPYIPSSSGFAKLPAGFEGAWPDGKSSGVYSGGPYRWTDPHEYYRLADKDNGWVFKDETGIPSQPPYNTLAKNITNLVWDKSLPYPLNNSWGYHDAATGAGRYDLYYQEMVKRYGEPKNMEDFSNKMQLLNSIGYQGIFEAAGHKLNESGGVMLWKLNAAFPSVIWQIYDWFLEPNAGYYAMQNACEPVHIQLNLNDSTVAVINRTHYTTAKLTADAEVFTMDTKSIFHQTATVTLPATGVKGLISLKPVLARARDVSFVMLKLKDASGKIVSRNTYWLAPDTNYRAMQQMPNAKLQTKVLETIAGKKATEWMVQISNTSNQLAFFVRPQLVQQGEEVMPAYWSASYFTLAPGDKITLTVSAPNDKLKGGDISIDVSAWNVAKQTTH